MLVPEIGELLDLIVMTERYPADRRINENAVVMHWHDLLRDIPFEDARAAVQHHRRTSTEYLQPAHIRKIVGTLDAMRRRELVRAQVEQSGRTPPIGPAQVAQMREIVHAERDRVAIESGRRQRELPAASPNPATPASGYASQWPALREHPCDEARALGCSPADLRPQHTVDGAA